ncbi:phage portal protein [Vallitalea maricola]|uniref:Phage portal protein n=1 Tax=Vallitalea maricola TaxID=3074433 RepID=A0ACB5UFG2_9FIRM|nr:phage portal protein [Vallitalea sp. AN17-2]
METTNINLEVPTMIKVSKGTEVTGELINKIIDIFNSTYVPRFDVLEKYYDVKNQILEREMNDTTKPNNKLAHGFAKYITNMATSYFLGQGINYTTKDNSSKKKRNFFKKLFGKKGKRKSQVHRSDYIDALNEVMNDNNNDNVNYETSKQTSINGVAFELLYVNENAKVKYKKFKADEIIPVYSNDVDNFLAFAIRPYEEKDILTDEIKYYADVYTKDEIITYIKTDESYVEEERKTHPFGDVPVLVYWNNEERKGDFEDVISLIDAYDLAQSDTANDFEYFTDAYLVLVGASGLTSDDDSEDSSNSAKTLKEERILLLDEKGQAQWLIKNMNDTAVENYKNRLYKDIFFLSQVPALTDESFAGNLTGIAIKYKLIGLEQLAIMKENKFEPAEKKKIKLITNVINMKKGTGYNPDDIEIIFTRNMILNDLEDIEKAQGLEGITSKRTQLKQLNFIDDVDEEIEQIEREKEKENDSLDFEDDLDDMEDLEE